MFLVSYRMARPFGCHLLSTLSFPLINHQLHSMPPSSDYNRTRIFNTSSPWLLHQMSIGSCHRPIPDIPIINHSQTRKAGQIPPRARFLVPTLTIIPHLIHQRRHQFLTIPLHLGHSASPTSHQVHKLPPETRPKPIAPFPFTPHSGTAPSSGLGTILSTLTPASPSD
jgi:hypothetical protein